MKKGQILLIIVFVFLLGLVSCKKENENQNDLRLKYIGQWNFKGNGYTYSGYYVYDSLMNSQWVENVTITTNYNDSTGIVQLGQNENELVFKYCESCDPVIYNLDEIGLVYSSSLGGNVGWTLTDTTFFNIITPQPPGYSTSYSTYNIEGRKL